MISTDCGTCPFADKCYMKDKFQRLPRRQGGLGLCPKDEIGWALETCNEPIVQHIKGRKKNCPFMEQVRKELRR